MAIVRRVLYQARCDGCGLPAWDYEWGDWRETKADAVRHALGAHPAGLVRVNGELLCAGCAAKSLREALAEGFA